ncbi:MAG: 50S ribosomal protein L21 [bacterium]|nr:50S ribosomal protein L21 [bacterium]
MKAVIETGGKQYYVSEGTVLFVEKLDEVNAGEKVKFDKVLMVDETVGMPFVKGAYVEGEVVKNGKGKKIIVYKYNQKKNYRRKQGHRQPYTKVEIKKIVVK